MTLRVAHARDRHGLGVGTYVAVQSTNATGSHAVVPVLCRDGMAGCRSGVATGP